MSGEKHKRGNKKHTESRSNRSGEDSKVDMGEFIESVNERMKNLVVARKPYKARNSRELSVKQGQMFEVLADDGSWWCLRDPSGKTGHVPQQNLEVIPNLASDSNFDRESANEPIVIRVPVVVQTIVQRDDEKQSSPPKRESSPSPRRTSPSHDRAASAKAEKDKRSRKTTEPKSLAKLRKMRAATEKALKKPRAASVSSACSAASRDSQASASSTSIAGSIYEAGAARKNSAKQKKESARKASPAPKSSLKESRAAKPVNCCDPGYKTCASEKVHCCETLRHCCHSCTPCPKVRSPYDDRYDETWRSPPYRTMERRSPRQQPPQPRAPSPPKQEKQPMIIVVEAPNNEPPEPEVEEDAFGGNGVPIQIMFTPSGGYTSQMTFSNQIPQSLQQPLMYYPPAAAQTATTNQWPASPYYVYS